ncbi:hypothetical protein ElyMa_001962100 [Elysia marginata]|uniref:Uncharacterized protein n=1 Tax=Elysia marginata TaxID=1093978 RepID=A0AAV4EZF2_9GAST|nr:hypothetical protein ElyMa_001962100 [Elysia marginata]
MWSGCYFNLTQTQSGVVYTVETSGLGLARFGAYLFSVLNTQTNNAVCFPLGIPATHSQSEQGDYNFDEYVATLESKQTCEEETTTSPTPTTTTTPATTTTATTATTTTPTASTIGTTTKTSATTSLPTSRGETTDTAGEMTNTEQTTSITQEDITQTNTEPTTSITQEDITQTNTEQTTSITREDITQTNTEPTTSTMREDITQANTGLATSITQEDFTQSNTEPTTNTRTEDTAVYTSSTRPPSCRPAVPMHTNVTFTTEEVEESVEKIVTHLSVKPETLSSVKRSKISAPDDRVSSATMGMGGVAFIGLVLGLVILSDVVKILSDIRLAWAILTKPHPRLAPIIEGHSTPHHQGYFPSSVRFPHTISAVSFTAFSPLYYTTTRMVNAESTFLTDYRCASLDTSPSGMLLNPLNILLMMVLGYDGGQCVGDEHVHQRQIKVFSLC